MHLNISDYNAELSRLMDRVPTESDVISEEAFNRLALALFALQRTHNPVVSRWADYCEIVEPTDWRQIPALNTSSFKEFDVTCLAPSERQMVFHSSGTTEQIPSRHYHSGDSLRLYERSAARSFELLFKPRSLATPYRFVFLTPPQAQAPNSSLVHMFEVLRRTFGDPGSEFFGLATGDEGWRLKTEQLVARLRLAERNDPVLLFGTAFNFVQLLDHLAADRTSLRLPAGSVAVQTGGYKGRTRSVPVSELYRSIRELLGIEEIRSEYGMSELSSQAYDAGADAEEDLRFRFPPWVRTRVVKPGTERDASEGEPGLLQIFDLANAYSALAIETGDLAIADRGGFRLVGRAQATESRGCSLHSADTFS